MVDFVVHRLCYVSLMLVVFIAFLYLDFILFIDLLLLWLNVCLTAYWAGCLLLVSMLWFLGISGYLLCFAAVWVYLLIRCCFAGFTVWVVWF